MSTKDDFRNQGEQHDERTVLSADGRACELCEEITEAVEVLEDGDTWVCEEHLEVLNEFQSWAAQPLDFGGPDGYRMGEF